MHLAESVDKDVTVDKENRPRNRKHRGGKQSRDRLSGDESPVKAMPKRKRRRVIYNGEESDSDNDSCEITTRQHTHLSQQQCVKSVDILQRSRVSYFCLS